MSKKLGKILVPIAFAAAVFCVIFVIGRKNGQNQNVQNQVQSEELALNVHVPENQDAELSVSELSPSNQVATGTDSVTKPASEDKEKTQESQNSLKSEKNPKNQKSEISQNSKIYPLNEGEYYYSKDDVARYIREFGKLPKNFITKAQAEKLGWSPGVPLSDIAEGMCIGGDRFYNREGVLPKKSGRTYTECDIDTLNKKSRGAKRLVFSNDGYIYYTEDHYETFEELPGSGWLGTAY